MPRKTYPVWVIFAQPQRFKAPNVYYDSKGGKTKVFEEAKKFSTWQDAKEFADEKGIDLGGMAHIAQP